ncbi:coiled-coil domain-containing protein [Serratia liquefaciens]|uniref:coiled-coil domain-containing protein n=1 Tax=Serratia liquefaciens TaxID=614 RepID=UPI00380DC2B7
MSNIGDIKDDVAIIFKERIAGPLGYVVVSFIGYNWSWIYFLTFSAKPAESKIKTVQNQFEFCSGFGWPLLIGFSLAALTPFLKVVMIHITAFARRLEDQKNYQIKNHLDQYIEDSKLELTRKREEITERNSKISTLMSQKKKLDEEIEITRKTIENIREEDKNLRDSIEEKKREIHYLEGIHAEYKIDVNQVSTLRERLYEKSNQYSTLKRTLIIFRDETKKLTDYFSNESNIHRQLNDINLYMLKDISERIEQKMLGIDADYFKIIDFEFKNSDTEVDITSIKSIDWSKITEILKENSLPTNGFSPNAADSVTLFFNQTLTQDDKRKLKSIFMQYVENN